MPTFFTRLQRRARRSTDGGNTWSALSISGAAVNTIAIDPSNSQTLYAGTNDQGALKSTDGGSTWTRINNGIAPAPDKQLHVPRIWVEPNAPNVLFASVYTGVASVYDRSPFALERSSDGGSTWQTVAPLNVVELSFDALTPGVIYAAALSAALKSVDDGQTWTFLWSLQISLQTSWEQIFSITADPSHSGRLVIGSNAGIYVSTDAGANWAPGLSLLPAGARSALIPDWANGVLYAVVNPSHVVKISSDLKTVTPVGPPALAFVSQIAVANSLVFVAVQGSNDVFVTKLDPAGNVVYSTYFGGSADDQARAMAVDPAGNVYVAGISTSYDFPTTMLAYAASIPPPGGQYQYSFVFRLNPDGSVGYSTYFTGTGSTPNAVAVDAAGEAYVAGTTQGGLPTTSGVYQPSFSGSYPPCCSFVPLPNPTNAFLAKFDASGSRLIFSTYIGTQSETATSLALGADGSAYLAGNRKLYHMNASGTSLLASMIIPGVIQALAVGGDESLYLAGTEDAYNPLPPTPGAFQPAPVAIPSLPGTGPATYTFVAKVGPGLRQILAATLLGGAYGDLPQAIAVDPSGNVFVVGSTAPRGFPTRTPLQSSFASSTGFLSELNSNLTDLLFSTYLGNTEIFSVKGVALAPDGVVLAGSTGQPYVASGGPSRVWVNKISVVSPPALRIDAVLNAASLLSTPLAVGEAIVVRGAGFGSDAQLSIGGVVAPALSITPNAITAVVPPGIPGGNALEVQVQSGGAASNQVLVQVAATSPGLFSADGSGVGQGHIFNADGTLNSPSNPAKAGDPITIFATGPGPVTFDGPYAVAEFLPAVFIDGFYALGLAAVQGPVAGLSGDVYQLTILVPGPAKLANLNPNLANFKLPPLVSVVLKMNGLASQNGIALSVAQQ